MKNTGRANSISFWFFRRKFPILLEQFWTRYSIHPAIFSRVHSHHRCRLMAQSHWAGYNALRLRQKRQALKVERSGTVSENWVSLGHWAVRDKANIWRKFGILGGQHEGRHGKCH